MNILITGSARGLGFETVKAALALGHSVFAGVRDMERHTEPLRALRAAHPDRLTLIAMDVTDEESVKNAKSAVLEHTDVLDALINNAGVLIGREHKLEELDFADMEQSMLANLYGPMKAVKHFLPLLRRSAKPCIINISSEAGCFTGAYGGDYPYAISKSGLNYFTAQLRKELTPQNFAIYAVHPGWIRTPMGGDQAPGDPADTAQGLLRIVERTVIPDPNAWMVNHRGEAMPF